MVACGALARDIALVAAANGWPVDVHPLPPVLHNRPERIAAAVEAAVIPLLTRYGRVIVGYADCGTHGALDEVCARLGVARLPGSHCYDVYAGPSVIAALLAEQPGTYLLTDFLVRAFDRLVLHELGLDRYPFLREDYFGNYTRVVWLRGAPDRALDAAATAASEALGLPLEVVECGTGGLDAALAVLMVVGDDRRR